MLAARPVGGGRQTRKVSGTAKASRDATQGWPRRCEVDTRGGLAYGLRKDEALA